MRYAGRFRDGRARHRRGPGCAIGHLRGGAGPSPAAGCNTVPKPPTAGGASIAQASANNVQQKNWQPRGGEVEFTLRSFVSLPPDAQVLVCFRWKTDPDGVDPYVESRPSRLDRSSDGLTLKVTTTVPNLPRFSNAAAPVCTIVSGSCRWRTCGFSF